MLYNALSMGKKTPKIAPSPWDCVTPSEADRATAIGNMHKNMLADRKTHTQTYLLQYFATTPAGVVITVS